MKNITIDSQKIKFDVEQQKHNIILANDIKNIKVVDAILKCKLSNTTASNFKILLDKSCTYIYASEWLIADISNLTNTQEFSINLSDELQYVIDHIKEDKINNIKKTSSPNANEQQNFITLEFLGNRIEGFEQDNFKL